ncbi:MAG: hypothetical protein HY961_06975 [Ignavibacteriae bacterium]|nr:hypothetical protein [Ignavibacteriota bacterium]
MLRHAIVLLALTLCVSHGNAQTSINPDISVIPRFLIESNDGERLAEGIRKFSRPDFQFQELEVVISSYLNPFAKADVIMTLPGPDLEAGKLGLEELYLSVLRGLPLDLNVRLGKYRVDFGKLNVQHPHQWAFVTQPLSQERFLGEEGLNDLGISLSTLLPTGDVYSKLTLDVLRGSSIGEATGIEDTTGAKPTYATSGRLMSFFTLTDNSDLETGVSFYTGIHDPYFRERFWYWNLDFKYKYKPDMYTSLVLQGEYLFNTRNAHQDRDFNQFIDVNGNSERRSISTSGLYLFADYQFLKIYTVGARFDWSQSPYSKDDRARAIALFLGYYPVEETLGLRLQYQNTRTELPGSAQSINSIALQILFSLGPHKAHPF